MEKTKQKRGRKPKVQIEAPKRGEGNPKSK